MKTLQVIRYAVLSGTLDMTAIYTWKSWFAGWYLRILAQVVFFALAGRLLGSQAQTWFLLIGNCTMLAAQQGVWSLTLTTWERDTGSLPLLLASPTSAVVVYASRGAYLIADGVVSALGAFVLTGLIFDLPVPWPQALLVPPLLLIVAASAYAFGTFLAGVLFRFREISNFVSGITIVLMMVLCGVNVPLEAYPPAAALVANFLPLTHGLQAVRTVFDRDLATAAQEAALELLVGSGWFVACVATFARLIDSGRRSGSLEFT